jgi:putative iron-dependent peroxidase
MTGCLFFVPTIDFLDNLPDPPGAAAPKASAALPVTVTDGSLRIGGLQRSAQQ